VNCFAAVERCRESKRQPSEITASIPLDESLRDLKTDSRGASFLFTVEGPDIQSAKPCGGRTVKRYAGVFSFAENAFCCEGRSFDESDNDRAPQVAGDQ